MKAIVHIGSPKAGSTSIQQFLWVNRNALATQGFRYQRDVKTRSSQFEYPMAAMAGQGVLLPAESQRILYDARTLEAQKKSSNAFVKRLKVFPRKWKEPVALFSSEHILPWLKTPELIGAFDRMFGDIFEDVRYVVYFRAPIETVTSQYSERLKRGDTSATLREFIDQRLSGLNIFKPANKWLNAVGQTRLEVRLLDKSLLKAGDLIEDYCDACGIDSTNLTRPPRSNEALSAPAAECLRILNTRIPSAHPDGGASNRLREDIVSNMIELSAGSPKLSLKPRQQKRIAMATAQDSERFRKAFFPDTETLFAPRESPQPIPGDADLRDMALHLMAELLIRARVGHLPQLSRRQKKKSFAAAFRAPTSDPPPDKHDMPAPTEA